MQMMLYPLLMNYRNKKGRMSVIAHRVVSENENKARRRERSGVEILFDIEPERHQITFEIKIPLSICGSRAAGLFAFLLSSRQSFF